jgi:hypothetical protein
VVENGPEFAFDARAVNGFDYAMIVGSKARVKEL